MSSTFVSSDPTAVRDTLQPSGTLAILHDWVVTVDHKRLGLMYLLNGILFLVVAGQ